MTQKAINGVTETRHGISEPEREAAAALLAANDAHFANFTGTMREAYDAATTTPVAPGVVLEEVAEHKMRGWWVRPHGAPDDRVILFIHGGAYMLGSAMAYRGFASELAVRTGVAAFVLDYPLAPEHKFPAAFDAAVEARGWLHRQGYSQIALVGDSAGGGLALGAMVQAYAEPSHVASVVTFSPWVDLALTGTSFNDPTTHDPIFHTTQIPTDAAKTYLAGANPKDGRASPLFAVPKALPPLAIQVGTEELLLDDARRYAEAAAAQGNEVRLDIYEGLYHVFQRSVAELPSARKAMDAAAEFVTRHWQNPAR